MAERIPAITAFEASPDRWAGLARDMRVRWALEEVGRPYGPAGGVSEPLRQRGPRRGAARLQAVFAGSAAGV